MIFTVIKIFFYVSVVYYIYAIYYYIIYMHLLIFVPNLHSNVALYGDTFECTRCMQTFLSFTQWDYKKYFLMCLHTVYLSIRLFFVYTGPWEYLDTYYRKIVLHILRVLHETFWNFIGTAVRHYCHRYIAK